MYEYCIYAYEEELISVKGLDRINSKTQCTTMSLNDSLNDLTTGDHLQIPNLVMSNVPRLEKIATSQYRNFTIMKKTVEAIGYIVAIGYRTPSPVRQDETRFMKLITNA